MNDLNSSLKLIGHDLVSIVSAGSNGDSNNSALLADGCDDDAIRIIRLVTAAVIISNC